MADTILAGDSSDTDDSRECAVEDCHHWGRPQVCPYDEKYHHHGRIHYDSPLAQKAHPGLRFRPVATAGWRGVCKTHMQEIEAAVAVLRG